LRAWQKCDAATGHCYCDSSCLTHEINLPHNPPGYYDNPHYNDDTVHDTGNRDVTLPAVMDWTENAWQDRHGENKNSCKGPFEVEDFGVRSFWIQIDNPNDQLFEPEKVPDSTYSNNVLPNYCTLIILIP